MNKEEFLAYLKTYALGEHNAIKGYSLVELFGGNTAKIRGMVNQLRCEGALICSGRSGYYYPATRAEVSTTIDQLRSRIGGMVMAIEGMSSSVHWRDFGANE